MLAGCKGPYASLKAGQMLTWSSGCKIRWANLCLNTSSNSMFPKACTFPQYGYLPGRSTTYALRRVFEHCAQVREACRGHGHSVLKRFYGQEPAPLTGGVQVTVDLTGAFHSIPRQQLLRGMKDIGLPARVVEVVMEWHCAAAPVTALSTMANPDSSR